MAVATKPKRVVSQETRDKLRAAAVRQHAAVTDGPSQAVEGDVIPPSNETLTTFQNFMAALAGSAKSKEEQSKALSQIGELVDKLDFRANPDLLNNPDVQKFIEMVNEARTTTRAGDLLPGSEIGQGWAKDKLPWTERDIQPGDGAKVFESYRAAVARGATGTDLVEYTPRETVEVVYNGLPYKFYQDVTVVVQKCFVDQAEYRHQQMRSAAENSKRLFKENYDPRFIDPTMLGRAVDQQGFRTMAHITKGAFNPNAGMALMSPDQATIDMAAKMDGEGDAAESEGGEAA